jgi:TonB family protein
VTSRGGRLALIALCLTAALPAAAQPPIGAIRISAQDFPDGVAPDAQEHISRLSFTVDSGARVTDCRVARSSSGEPRLDEQACRMLRERMRLRLRYGRRNGTVNMIWSRRDDRAGVNAWNPRGAPIPINFNNLVAWNDYPASALRFNRDGDVLYEVDVSENGAPTACRVTHSSGTPELDARTCALMMRRGAFLAASDGQGGRIAGRFVGRFLWRTGWPP